MRCDRHHDAYRHGFHDGLKGTGRYTLGDVAFLLHLEIDDVVDHLEDGGLVVQRHDLGARQHPDVPELLQQLDRGAEHPVPLRVGIVITQGKQGCGIDGVGRDRLRHQVETGKTGLVQHLPVDTGLELVGQAHLDDGRLYQHLAVGVGERLADQFAQQFMLRFGCLDGQYARFRVGNDGIALCRAVRFQDGADVRYQVGPEMVGHGAADGGG